mmetsp:Transcript_20411/g.46777  ORF Transcript_20411/g.46777 Transcript_20411/m.46777 type:complete len:83 (-) Transcript_20411:238-486(-)
MMLIRSEDMFDDAFGVFSRLELFLQLPSFVPPQHSLRVRSFPRAIVTSLSPALFTLSNLQARAAACGLCARSESGVARCAGT